MLSDVASYASTSHATYLFWHSCALEMGEVSVSIVLALAFSNWQRPHRGPKRPPLNVGLVPIRQVGVLRAVRPQEVAKGAGPG